jgi:hypothetical protein
LPEPLLLLLLPEDPSPLEESDELAIPDGFPALDPDGSLRPLSGSPPCRTFPISVFPALPFPASFVPPGELGSGTAEDLLELPPFMPARRHSISRIEAVADHHPDQPCGDYAHCEQMLEFIMVSSWLWLMPSLSVLGTSG